MKITKKQWITILTLIAAITSAILGVLTSSCTSYLIATRQATDTDVKVSTTTTVDSLSIRLTNSK